MNRLLIASFAAAALSGCTPTVNVRGNVVDEDVLAQIRPGFSSKQDVVQIMGSPSTVPSFESNTWIYIGETTEQVAFFEPEVLDRRIFKVTFGEDGLVKDTAFLNKDAGTEVEMVDRVTPTEGRQLTILQQLFGNIGRFPRAGAGGQ